MKLLFCKKCQDTFKLDTSLRSCRCGRTFGGCDAKYQAWFSGKFAVPLVVDWQSFMAAAAKQSASHGVPFTACVAPLACAEFQDKTGKDAEAEKVRRRSS